MQQQFDGLDRGVGVKPRPQAALMHHIGQRRDRHALMMRHEAADDGKALALGQAAAGKVQRLVKAMAPHGPQVRQHGKVG
ncbi:MAG: hypothetical protein B7Y02_14480, partial [Rhodobacterales bacterium 17-64-5]